MNNIKTEEHKISLLPHNQKLYDEIIESLKNGSHSVFFTEATGLGKSFIFMRLVYDLFNKDWNKVLYIVPQNSIWDNINFYKEFEYIKDRVEMTTYADFNISKFKHYDYDAIFVDECHHLISEIQGNNILTLMKEYVEACRYVFGLTATPEVKSGKIVVNADQYFDSKVYGMDIYEAIESGLLPKIEYAIADPDTVIKDEEYRKRYSIDGTKTLLENILAERSDITRWLVYFSNIKTLKENMGAIAKLLPNYKIFVMHSQNKNNDEQLKEFNEYTGKSMLLTVSMVLEGIHPKKVGGILLYRNIRNFHTFQQALGRVCYINAKRSPLVVDIVKCVDAVSLKYLDDCVNGTGKYGGKSSNGRKRSLKPILDIKASSYRYIELIEYWRLSKMQKSYRDYTWASYADLSRQLGFDSTYVSILLKQGKYNSCEEIIDAKYNNEFIRGIYTYKDYTWIDLMDLSRQLGYKSDRVSVLLKQGKYNSCEEIIDARLNNTLGARIPKMFNYRGYKYKSRTDLSKQLGRSSNYVQDLISSGRYNSCEEIIDAKYNILK